MSVDDWKKLPKEVAETLRKYRIISVQDKNSGGRSVKVEGYTTANLRKSRDAEGKALGDGPLLSLECVRRLVEADTSSKHAWLDWMLFHCGGGLEAERRSTQAMEQVRERFIEERVRGFRDMTGAYYAPVTKEEATKTWESSDCKFREVLRIADQDMVEKLQVFGFYRNWPGFNGVYEKATKAVSTFLELRPKIKDMNQFMTESSMPEKVIKTAPSDYVTVDALETAIKKVERFYLSRAAREDMRVDVIYEDDVILMLAPLSYAASVRYGWDGWAWSNREHFEANLETSANNWNDAWKKAVGTEKKIFVFVQFKVPVPSWVSYTKPSFARYTFHNLALAIALDKFKGKAGDDTTVQGVVSVVNEENTTISLVQVQQEFMKECSRDDNPDTEEFPIRRGPRVFKTQDEAEKVLEHFSKALDAMHAWGRTFDQKSIVADYMPEAR